MERKISSAIGRPLCLVVRRLEASGLGEANRPLIHFDPHKCSGADGRRDLHPMIWLRAGQFVISALQELSIARDALHNTSLQFNHTPCSSMIAVCEISVSPLLRWGVSSASISMGIL